MKTVLVLMISVILALTVLGEVIDFNDVYCTSTRPWVRIKETDKPGLTLLDLPTPRKFVNVKWTLSTNLVCENVYEQFVKIVLVDSKYQLKLIRTVDIDYLYNEKKINATELNFILECSSKFAKNKRDFMLYVKPVDEWAPKFTKDIINVSLFEVPFSNVTVVNLAPYVTDKDFYPHRTIRSYYLKSPESTPMFGVDEKTGRVFTRKKLDFESIKSPDKTTRADVYVKDASGKSGTATVILKVIDIADNQPRFFYDGCEYPCENIIYRARINPNFTGKLDDIKPDRIHAISDGSQSSSIIYQLKQGPESVNMKNQVRIDPKDASIEIVEKIHGIDSDTVSFYVQAKHSDSDLSSKAVLVIRLDANMLLSMHNVYDGTSELKIVSIVLGLIILLLAAGLWLATLMFKRKISIIRRESMAQNQSMIEDTMQDVTEEDAGKEFVPPVRDEFEGSTVDK